VYSGFCTKRVKYRGGSLDSKYPSEILEKYSFAILLTAEGGEAKGEASNEEGTEEGEEEGEEEEMEGGSKYESTSVSPRVSLW
jgi:hypothetical protein